MVITSFASSCEAYEALLVAFFGRCTTGRYGCMLDFRVCGLAGFKFSEPFQGFENPFPAVLGTEGHVNLIALALHII